MATNEYQQGQTAAAEPTSWASHVLIPVAQNVLGGMAVAGLGLMGVYAYGVPIDGVAGLWCAFGGAAVTCIITLTRFFGDDLGIIAAAYRAGQASRDPQIAALQLELRTSRDAQTAAEAEGNQASVDRRREEFRKRAREDALKIIAVHFDGDSIARAAMGKRGMGQRDWERAVRLMVAAGVINGDGVMIARTPAQSLRAIDQVLASGVSKGKAFHPAWK